VVPTVALLEDGENGPHCSLHHPRQFCIRDGFDAVVVLAVLDGRLYPARMTTEVCCTASKLSAKSEALPW
jgi:hypothetical protein